MDKSWVQLAVLLIQLLVLYPLIHRSTYELFRMIYAFIRNKNVAFACIAALFLPGTLVHEMSHFFAATVLLLPVGEVKILPEWHENQIRLGKVTYAKADFIRSVLVGIAPVFGAVLVLSLFYFFKLFPSGNILVNIAEVYLFFSITANMYSSRQDLVDLVYLVPLLILVAALWYITGITVNFTLPAQFASSLVPILQFINICITISLAVHVVIIICIRSLWLLFNK